LAANDILYFHEFQPFHGGEGYFAL
jgi:hypothetical protein